MRTLAEGKAWPHQQSCDCRAAAALVQTRVWLGGLSRGLQTPQVSGLQHVKILVEHTRKRDMDPDQCHVIVDFSACRQYWTPSSVKIQNYAFKEGAQKMLNPGGWSGESG